MAKPIHHNTGSSVSTAASGAVKGGLLGGAVTAIGTTLMGALTGGLATALVVGGVTALGTLALAATPVLTIGAVVPTALAAAGWAGGIGAAISGAVSLVAGSSVALIGAEVGALLGIAKGGDKVARENGAYKHKMEQKMHTHEVAVNNAGMLGMQQGYGQGFQEGQAAMVTQLREMQEKQLMDGALVAKGGHAANVMQERAGKAAAPQLG